MESSETLPLEEELNQYSLFEISECIEQYYLIVDYTNLKKQDRKDIITKLNCLCDYYNKRTKFEAYNTNFK